MRFLATEKFDPSYIEAKVRGEIVRVSIEDVHYFFAEHKYVTLFADGVEILLTPSLKTLSEIYGDRFLFAGRNVLVARDRLMGEVRGEKGKSFIALRGCSRLAPMTRRYTRTLRPMLSEIAQGAQTHTETTERVD